MKDEILLYARNNGTFTVPDLVEAGFNKRIAYYHVRDLEKRSLIKQTTSLPRDAGAQRTTRRFAINRAKLSEIESYIEGKQAKRIEDSDNSYRPVSDPQGTTVSLQVLDKAEVEGLSSLFIGTNDAGWKPVFNTLQNVLPKAFAELATDGLSVETDAELQNFQNALERTVYVIQRLRISKVSLDSETVDRILINNDLKINLEDEDSSSS